MDGNHSYTHVVNGKIEGNVGFIGAGNMAKAICEGLVTQGLASYSQIHVSAPHVKTLEHWKDLGVNTYLENGKVLEKAAVVFLAVKPHVLAEAVSNCYDTYTDESKVRNKLFVSVLAGVTTQSLENILGGFEGSRVVRVMPNTPVMVGSGCCVYCPGQNATADDERLVCALVSSLGMCTLVPESMISAAGALAGSGPAFVYLVIDALSDGGVKMGLPRSMANQFAAQTVFGAAKMVLDTGRHPGALKDEVCSPGGTTIAGIHALERGGVRSAFMDAVEAATLKAREVAKGK